MFGMRVIEIPGSRQTKARFQSCQQVLNRDARLIGGITFTQRHGIQQIRVLSESIEINGQY